MMDGKREHTASGITPLARGALGALGAIWLSFQIAQCSTARSDAEPDTVQGEVIEYELGPTPQEAAFETGEAVTSRADRAMADECYDLIRLHDLAAPSRTKEPDAFTMAPGIASGTRRVRMVYQFDGYWRGATCDFDDDGALQYGKMFEYPHIKGRWSASR